MKEPGTLSNNILEGNSVVTSIKNREKYLRQSLPSWIEHPKVDEVIVLDWDSNPSLENYIKDINSEKIKYIRVENQKYYYITLSTNLAAKFTTRNKLLFLDSDIILSKDFFNRHVLRKGVFYTGNWRLARNQNECHLNGQFYLFREDFFRVNGFDERLQTYGWDDTDLYYRLCLPPFLLRKAKYVPSGLFWNYSNFALSILGGLARLNISPDTLQHIEHEDTKRIENYPEQKLSPTDSIQKNRKQTLLRLPWTYEHSQADYDLRKVSSSHYIAKQIEQNFIAIKPINGLGNRLRVIASCWAVAEALGKKLYVCWEKSSGFSDEKFESLFSTQLDLISEATYRKLENNRKNIVLNNKINKYIKYSDSESGYYQDLDFWTKGINKSNLLYEWQNSLDHFSLEQIKKNKLLSDFDKLFEQKLKLFKPSQSIQERIEEFERSNFNSNNVVGIHIRRGDAIKSPWSNEYSVSTDEKFITSMQDEISTDSNIKFFLSTDCPETLRKFKEHYNGRVISYEKNFVESNFGEEKNNQKEALIEMMLLARTSKIIGSRWSTFSEMASKIGGVRLEICS